MGIDMRTLGSSLAFHPNVSEEDILELAKLSLEDANLKHEIRVPTISEIRQASSLDELFRCFRQNIIRNEAETVVGTVGVDDRLCWPVPLFESVAISLQEGSWYAYVTDNGGYLLFIQDGAAREIPMNDWVLDRGTWEWCHRNVTPERAAEDLSQDLGRGLLYKQAVPVIIRLLALNGSITETSDADWIIAIMELRTSDCPGGDIPKLLPVSPALAART